MSWDPVGQARPRYEGPASALLPPRGPEDFRVEEIALYPASGMGEHLFVLVEKRDLTTPEMIGRLAAALDLDAREIGRAGLKDRRAITRQWISLPRRAAEGRLEALDVEGLRILEARPHGNKLRPGHLAGNRFSLFLAGDESEGFLRRRLDELREKGLPNYFGPQRFGARGDNHLEGRRLLEAARKPRGARAKLLANAWQSCLFNRVLAERLEALDRLLPGDLAWIHGKGAVFRVEDPEVEAGRVAALEISPSGPLPGKKMSVPAGEAGRLERRLLEEVGWTPNQDRHLAGARRPLRVPVGDLEASREEGGLRLAFVLPPGSYATVLLRELGIRPER